MTPRETLSASEAKRRVAEARRAVLVTLDRGGIVLEEGKPDAEGYPFSKARIHEIRQEIDQALWDILDEIYVVRRRGSGNMTDDETNSGK